MAITPKETDVRAVIKDVESSTVFSGWVAQNPHHELVHVFTQIGATTTPMEIGYYGHETEKITVFRTNPVVALPPEDIFTQGGAPKALDVDAIRIGLSECLDLAERQRQKDYPQHRAIRTICILQQQETPVWNLTLVTDTLQMIIMRFDATRGELLSRQLQSIMSIVKE